MNEGMPIEGLEPKRGPGRPPLRRDEPRASAETTRPDLRSDSLREAEEYAARIVDQVGDRPYEADIFYIDPAQIPEGWSYEWKAAEVVGKENRHHMLELNRNGWRPVPATRHPEMAPVGHTGAIEVKGQILMELPKILSDKAKARHRRESIDALRNAEAKLYEAPPNTGPRDDPGVMNRINKVAHEIVNPNQGRMED